MVHQYRSAAGKFLRFSLIHATLTQHLPHNMKNATQSSSGQLAAFRKCMKASMLNNTIHAEQEQKHSSAAYLRLQDAMFHITLIGSGYQTFSLRGVTTNQLAFHRRGILFNSTAVLLITPPPPIHPLLVDQLISKVPA